ncbi:Hypothetical protein CINCED_3A004480 [Cinara cedri]|uniref:Uncharacterized protein n=1 Tax=Cinara cedri TaxID=506608 RepID=A0A5E4LYG5_9HEMI|nr:Hypothetical protein CINCED_3A004480 [Cinara cedri]
MICTKIFIALAVTFMLVEQGDGQQVGDSKKKKGIFHHFNLNNVEKLAKLSSLPERIVIKGAFRGAKELRDLLRGHRKNTVPPQLLQQGYGQYVDNSGKKKGISRHFAPKNGKKVSRYVTHPGSTTVKVIKGIIRQGKKLCHRRPKNTAPPQLSYPIPPGGPNYIPPPQ